MSLKDSKAQSGSVLQEESRTHCTFSPDQLVVDESEWSSERQMLHALEVCPWYQWKLDRTSPTIVEGLPDRLALWQSLGRLHPAKLRHQILTKELQSTPEILAFLEWSWKSYETVKTLWPVNPTETE